MNNNKYTLFIEDEITSTWYDLDIDNIDFTTVFALDELQDLSSRKDNYTKDLTINGTSKNNILLGRLYDISRHADSNSKQSTGFNFQANKYINCQLFENNVQLITGKLLVKDIVVKNGNITYSCTILGNVFSFFNEIKDRNLSDLDSIDDTVTFSIGDIQDSWVKTYSQQKYVYPSIDFGYDDRTSGNTWDNSFDIKNFKPATRLKYILLSIFRGWRFDAVNEKYTQFDELGNKLKKYNVQSDFLNEDNFERLIIPSNQEYISKTQYGIVYDFSAPDISAGGLFMLKGVLNINNSTNNYYTTPFVPDFEYLNVPTLNRRTGVNVTRGVKARDAGIKTTLNFSANVSLSIDVRGKFWVGVIDLNKTQDISVENMIVKTSIEQWLTPSTSLTKNLSSNSTIEIDANGHYILAYAREDQNPNNNTNGTIFIRDTYISFGSTTSTSVYPVSIGDTYPLYKSLAKDVKVSDFVKSVLLMFNLYILQDSNNPNLFRIETYNKVFEKVQNYDFSIAVDWTAKMDNTNYKLLTNIDLPKAYNFKYAEDDDMANENFISRNSKQYGELNFNLPNGISDEKEIEVIFAPTLNVRTSLNDKEIPYICKAESFFQGKKEPYQSKIRILYWNGRKSCVTYPLYYRGVTSQSIPYYGHSSMLKIDSNDNIVTTLFFDNPIEAYDSNTGSQNTLFNLHYLNQLRELNNSNLMLLEGDFLLNENDISTLNFTTPIYLETQFGGAYWKLLELEYRNNYTTSKVKLQKIV